MTPQQIFAVALRVFAIRLALSAINYLGPLENYLESLPSESPWTVTPLYALGASMLALALFLWFFPMLAAQTLLPRARFEGRASPQLHEAVRLGSALIGLWLLHEALPQLLLKLTFLLAYPPELVALLPHGARDGANLLRFAIEMLLSLSLMLGGGVFARLVICEAKTT